ncbi:MDR family MFS transporter [Rhodococcus sp. NBC_00297]|uniref:MDR family MFS transporter n=1 Tax=Rhodococcus sp. NBC_00297 TaxID=2976005 RepID=UPI002E2D5041|nr:MDR family MFS transporter [Rhodococcus sp. NBC_00297]
MHIHEVETHSEPVPDADHTPGNKLLIGVLVIATFVMVFNETIMSVALPKLMVDLEVTASTAQWLTTGFLLTMAVVIPTTGYLFQRFTLRQVFVSAMLLFTTGTLLAATAPGFELLLVGRVIQASGTAIMLPLLMTTVLRLIPAHERGRMMGIISIVIAVAPAVGPTISGIILDSLDWRWMFWLVLPIAIVAFAIGTALIKNFTTVGTTPFDAISVVMSALAFGGIVYGLSSLGHSAEAPPVPIWISLTVGIVALLLFVLRQLSRQRSGRALLDLRPFATQTFSVGLGMTAVSMMALFGALILLPMYLQNVLGLDTLSTGLTLLPGGLLMGIMAPLVGHVYDRIGPRPLVIPGAVIISASLWLMTLLDTETSATMVVATHMMLSAGLALVMTPLMTSSLGALPRNLYSHGSAIFNTVQQLAGAAGTALFITVMTRTTDSAIAGGRTEIVSAESGIHTAFLVGAFVSLVAVAASFVVGRSVVANKSTRASGATSAPASNAEEE